MQIPDRDHSNESGTNSSALPSASVSPSVHRWNGRTCVPACQVPTHCKLEREREKESCIRLATRRRCRWLFCSALRLRAATFPLSLSHSNFKLQTSNPTSESFSTAKVAAACRRAVLTAIISGMGKDFRANTSWEEDHQCRDHLALTRPSISQKPLYLSLVA